MISHLFSWKGRLVALVGKSVCELSILDGKATKRIIFTADSPLIKPAAQHDHLLLCADQGKRVHLVDLERGECLFKTTMERTVTACCFSPLDQQMLVADKFGNAFTLGTPQAPQDPAVWILGCISIITDMLATRTQIFTADRDERVRVSRLDKPYVIDQFLLEHGEYVACLALQPEADSEAEAALLTVGGGGEAFEWKARQMGEWVQTRNWQALPKHPFLAIGLGKEQWAVIGDNSSSVSILPNGESIEVQGIITAACLHEGQLYLATLKDNSIQLYREAELIGELASSANDNLPLSSLWKGNLRKLRGEELLASISYKHRRKNADGGEVKHGSGGDDDDDDGEEESSNDE